MPITPIAPFAPGNFITSAWANILAANQRLIDERTGGDPGVIGRLLFSGSTTGGIWRPLQSGDFPTGVIPDAAMANAKVSKAGDVMSGDLGLFRAGAPTTGFLYLGQTGALVYIGHNGSAILISGAPVLVMNSMTVTGGVVGANDARFYRTASPTTGFVYFGSAGTHYIGCDGTNVVVDGGKVWTSANDGIGSGLDAATVEGVTSGWLTDRAHHSGPLHPSIISPQGPTSGLNADMVDYAHAQTTPAADMIPVALPSGKIVNGWLAAATAPTPNQMPIADSSGKIANGWLVAGLTAAANQIPIAGAGGKIDPSYLPAAAGGSEFAIGMVMMWASVGAPPTGWVNYNTINSAINGRFPVGSTGAGGAYVVGSTGGTSAHRHDVRHGHTATTDGNPGGGNQANVATPNPANAPQGHTHAFTINQPGSAVFSGQPDSQDLPPWLALTFIYRSA